MSPLQRLRVALAVASALLACSAVARKASGRLPQEIKFGDEADIPPYVVEFAPLVHLHSDEYFWPSDIAEHLDHVHASINQTKLENRFTVDDLSDLNSYDSLEDRFEGRVIYLNSDDYIDMWKDGNIKDLPEWLTAAHNIPPAGDAGDVEGEVDAAQADILVQQEEEDELQEIQKAQYEDLSAWWEVLSPANKSRPTLPPARYERSSRHIMRNKKAGGRSSAPAFLIVVDRGDGVVDAFWFFFYSYNLGNSVFHFRFGNHVGDWEHSCIRFYKGIPKAIFLSEHEGGKSYTYRAMEKIGKRPVIYSASGTHAMYATAGPQPYVLPFRILRDGTSRGPLWDPLLNIYAYTYDSSLAQGHDREIRSIHAHDIPISSSDLKTSAIAPLNPFFHTDPLEGTIRPSSLTPNAPISWFYYRGHWGDSFLPVSDHRQYAVGPEKAYVSGPMGPRFKALGRKTVCPSDRCVLKDSIERRSLSMEIFIDCIYVIAVSLLLAGLTIMNIHAVRRCTGWYSHRRWSWVCGCVGRAGDRQDWEWWGKRAEAVDVDVEDQDQDGAPRCGEPSEINERTALLGGSSRHRPRTG